MIQRLLSVAICILMFSVAGLAEARTARVSDVRFGLDGEGTRVVIDADSPLEFRFFTLPNGTPRIVVEMPRVRWSIGGMTAEAGHGAGVGVVDQYRFEHNSPTTSRLILDLKGPAKVENSYAMGPDGETRAHRIVLDLGRVAEAEFRAAPTPSPDERVLLAHVEKSPALKQRKPLIVIDAGHGGKDPGAIGAHGVREKDVTLSAALALKRELERTGRYEVAMTRDNDVFIELEDRVARAREFQADLFISLHADAGSKSHTRGASVYTLSASGEARSQKLKSTQNWVLDVERDTARSSEVNEILASLVEREAKNQSARFARLLIPEFEKANWPILANTHRNAGFFVLLAPDVPAVLVEMGFLTNQKDEALLTSRHRKHVVKAMVRAVDAFFADNEIYVAQR